VEAIRRVLCELLPEAKAETLEALAAGSSRCPFARGQEILAPGTPLRVLILLDGAAGVYHDAPDGRRAILHIARAPDFVGVLSPYQTVQSVGAVALTPCDAVLFPGSLLSDSAARDDGVARNLLRWSNGRLDLMLRRLALLTFLPTRERLALALITYDVLTAGDGEHPPILGRSDLASLIGASREMTAHAFRALEREGLVRRIGRRRLEVLDREGLEQAAGDWAIDALGPTIEPPSPIRTGDDAVQCERDTHGHD